MDHGKLTNNCDGAAADLTCTVLHCTVLSNCTVLYCTVLYCTVLHLLYMRMSGAQMYAGGMRRSLMSPYSDSFHRRLSSVHSCDVSTNIFMCPNYFLDHSHKYFSVQTLSLPLHFE